MAKKVILRIFKSFDGKSFSIPDFVKSIKNHAESFLE